MSAPHLDLDPTSLPASAAPSHPVYRPGERLRPAEFARRENVSRQTVSRWIKEGRLSPPGPDGRLDAQRAQRERLASESPLPKHQGAKEAKARERAENRAAAPVTGQGAPVTLPLGGGAPSALSDATSALQAKQGDISAALKLETWRLQKAKAEQANMAIDRDAGLLVERPVVEYLLRDLGETIRAELTSFPDLHAPEMAACRGDAAALHKHLSDAAAGVLHRIAERLGQRAEDLLPAILEQDAA